MQPTTQPIAASLNWKLGAALLIGLCCCSCSSRRTTYRYFSFLKNDVVTLDTTLVAEAQERAAIMHTDSTWTWFGRLSTTFDLGYKLHCCNDSLFFFCGRDTFLLNDMLGTDTAYLSWFTLANFYNVHVYRLKNRYSGEQHLYLSWGRDSFGHAPGMRINVVFPLSKDGQVERGFAYMTSTATLESDPCLDCFTDANRDGKTDFVQWFYTDDAPVLYFNSSTSGERTYYDSGYKSIAICEDGPIYWEIVRKKGFWRFRKP